MPISPKEIADARLESTITKLCDLIDTKLRNSEKLPFEFTFLPDTSYEVCTKIAEIYRQVGWRASLSLVAKDNKNVLTLTTSNVITTAASNYISKTDAVLFEDTIDIVKKTMSEESGRKAIASAMTEPILTSLNLQSLLRRVLIIDVLNDGQLSNYYNNNVKDDAFYYTNKHEITPYTNIDESTNFLEISSPVVCAYPYNQPAIDECQNTIKNSLQNQEEQILIKLLHASTTLEQTIYTYPQTLNMAILDSIGEMESQKLISARILLHPLMYRKMFMNENMFPEFERCSKVSDLKSNLYGHLYSTEVCVSSCVPCNEIFITPPTVFLGAVAVKEELNIIPTVLRKINESEDKYSFAGHIAMLPIVCSPKNVRKIVVRL